MRTPLLLACLLIAACDVAPPPPADPDAKLAKPEASAATSTPAQDTGHHELKEGIETMDYREKAAAAGDPNLEADKKREEALKDQGG
jgi:hypothetical protein